MILECPYCQKPTTRQLVNSFESLVNYPYIIDEQGNLIQSGVNNVTHIIQCNECKNSYSIFGNNKNGFKYV